MLRVRHLLIHINTDKGVFGTRQDFVDGLNVVRAENYRGKSQFVQSIIYALGLEGMQSPSHATPLAHALTEYLEFSENGAKAKAKVIDSMVSMEIENGKGQFLTVQRAIAGDRNRNLVTVYEGRALTKKEALNTSKDYYVREGGAAVSELGFHRRLKDFIGWDLPMAPGSASRTARFIWRRSSPCFMSSRNWDGDACRRVTRHGSAFGMWAAELSNSSWASTHTPTRWSALPFRRRSSV
jgi:hypothetical protein